MSLKQTLAAGAVAVTTLFSQQADAQTACEAGWINSSAVAKTLFAAPVEKWQTQEIAKLGPEAIGDIFKQASRLGSTLDRDVDKAFKALERTEATSKDPNWKSIQKGAHTSFAGVLAQVESGALSVADGRKAASIAATEYVASAQKALGSIQPQPAPCLVAQ